MEIEILNYKGEKINKKFIFNDKYLIKPHKYSIYLDIKRCLFSKRHGNSKTKVKKEITGSTRKIQKQKGTGNSRKGSIKNPLFRGGARIFGPVKRNYKFKLNKNVKKLSQLSIINEKLKNNKIIILENFNIDNPKTKKIINLIKSLNKSKSLNFLKKKILIVTYNINKNLYLSCRNIPQINTLNFKEINSYNLLYYYYLIFIEDSLKYFLKKFDKIIKK
ncbi:50S ribosomal protein L4 [Candidatus Shikimatogenerans silvanidophilus]|uniref:50S ribosomal protein L4 n=1 Tax=Candidatus Shikimatogenerans silvanidophilus TaxID=2782547 RepID=UPI001BA71D9E|nr:50S ribosomal protein L4 [Candidatus Shikimatogenerans silvanidophilus]